MKISLKRFLIYALIIFCAGYAYGLTQVSPKVEKAQAQTYWGGCSGAYAQCPGTSGPISSCVQSSDFDITITSIGAAIPPGQQFVVTIEPADGSGTACEGTQVTCLRRVTTFYTKTHPTTSGGWPAGQTTWHMPLLNQIGCGTTGACTNNYHVVASFDDPRVDPTASCLNPPVPATIQNGSPNVVTVPINCAAPSPSPTACPTVPTVVPTITCPNCQ